MRSLEEIRTDILAPEQKTEGLLSEMIGTNLHDSQMLPRPWLVPLSAMNNPEERCVFQAGAWIRWRS